MTREHAPFSVKGGGHTAFAGGSSSDGGVTVDFGTMKAIEVAADRKSVLVQPGVRWIEVSQKLDPMQLAVMGGRAADVGVPGLILGGGLSYFSEKHGLACDNILEFEVVLASGKVVKASPMCHQDLYWALRGGGGSSFGIVTSFTIVAIEQGELWASDNIFPGSANVTLLPEYYKLVKDGLPKDNSAHTYLALMDVPQLGGYTILNSQFHSTPELDPPEIFRPIQALPGAIARSTRNATVSTLAKAIDEPYGMRQTWWDAAIGLEDAEILTELVALWKVRADSMLALVKDNSTFMPGIVYQPISTNLLKAMQQNGGNALGLRLEDGPLMNIQFYATWASPEMDDVIRENYQALVQETYELAKRKGVFRSFIYMNYAAKTQNVLQGYGQESFDRLKSISKRYDPGRKLQQLWQGYFQVDQN